MAHYLFLLLARIVRVLRTLKVIPGERKLIVRHYLALAETAFPCRDATISASLHQLHSKKLIAPSHSDNTLAAQSTWSLPIKDRSPSLASTVVSPVTLLPGLS